MGSRTIKCIWHCFLVDKGSIGRPTCRRYKLQALAFSLLPCIHYLATRTDLSLYRPKSSAICISYHQEWDKTSKETFPFWSLRDEFRWSKTSGKQKRRQASCEILWISDSKSIWVNIFNWKQLLSYQYEVIICLKHILWHILFNVAQ